MAVFLNYQLLPIPEEEGPDLEMGPFKRRKKEPSEMEKAREAEEEYQKAFDAQLAASFARVNSMEEEVARIFAQEFPFYAENSVDFYMVLQAFLKPFKGQKWKNLSQFVQEAQKLSDYIAFQHSFVFLRLKRAVSRHSKKDQWKEMVEKIAKVKMAFIECASKQFACFEESLEEQDPSQKDIFFSPLELLKSSLLSEWLKTSNTRYF